MCMMESQKVLSSVEILNNRGNSCTKEDLIARHIYRIFESFLKQHLEDACQHEKIAYSSSMEQFVKNELFSLKQVRTFCQQMSTLHTHWKFDSYEYMEIFLATQFPKLRMRTEKEVSAKFHNIVSLLAKVSNGDKSLFLKNIKEYNDLNHCIVHTVGKNDKESSEFLEEIFYKNYHKDISLSLWLNIYLDIDEDLDSNEFLPNQYYVTIKEIKRQKRECAKNAAANK